MMYLIWSNEEGAWFRREGGLTWVIGLAARYSADHARQVAGASLFKGLLCPPHPDLVLVPAPEDVAKLQQDLEQLMADAQEYAQGAEYWEGRARAG